MSKTRTLVFASVIAGAMLFGGLIGATAMARSPFANVNAASPSPSPGQFRSNEDPAHEKGESAAQEAAENNGTFHPGPGGPGGHSNEDPSHEKTESAAQEAAETS
jgi:hypothetical protein